MSSQIIGLMAAMPDEVKPLLRLVSPVTRENAEGFPLYRFNIGGAQCVLVESGMGLKRAAAAMEAFIAAVKPRVIVNFGFAGAVLPGLKAGDILLGEQSLLFDSRAFTDGAPLASPERLIPGLFPGTIITADAIVEKKGIASILPAGLRNPALDMETWGAALVAEKHGIPLYSVRGISDPADEELGFTIDEFVDKDMNIRIRRVLMTVARKPRIIPQLLRLARNTRETGKKLAEVVTALIKGVEG